MLEESVIVWVADTRSRAHADEEKKKKKKHVETTRWLSSRELRAINTLFPEQTMQWHGAKN